MDIDYLLLLQAFRNGVGAFLASFMLWISKFVCGYWVIAMIAMLYWVLDKKAGKRILAGFTLGLLANGFLKLTFCIYRPWIRDDRILPYGDSKLTATGYSFPSGHSTWATAGFENIGLWFRKHGHKVISTIFFIGVATVMFSRNYLGVHTPQDVIVGFLATNLMIFCANKIEDWSDKDTSRDKIILISGIILCIALALYYVYKPYPLTYLEDGSLLVDPKTMLADSCEGLGLLFGYSISRCIERKGFDFEAEMDKKDRFIVGVFALIPLYIWFVDIRPALAGLIGKNITYFIIFCGIELYILVLVPRVMKYVNVKYFVKNSVAKN